MNGVVEKSAEWIYRGVWRLLVDCFRMPQLPPALPKTISGKLQVFHPSRRFLSYLKLYFWVGLVIIDVAILIGWIVLLTQRPVVAWLLAVPALFIAIVPDIIAYIAIHLRYDTIWYAISERGVHLRRGILVVTEHTVSLGNIQNVSVCRGPIEQYFGIATLVIETAGATASSDSDVLKVGNRVTMVGLENVDAIREVLMARVRASRTAGLGDEPDSNTHGRLSETDLATLGDILAEVKRL